MAQIIINEISENYAYNIGNNSFATVALPITASWGPAFTVEDITDVTHIQYSEQLDSLAWTRFPATQAGLESFVATYRGPASNYRLAKDYSYQIAMTLLASGYDVLTCRICPGGQAQGEFVTSHEVEENTVEDGVFVIKAKYAGTFGNSLKIYLKKQSDGWSLVTYIVNTAGTQTAVENLRFTFDVSESDSIPHIREVESNFLSFELDGTITDSTIFDSQDPITLTGGDDAIFAGSDNETVSSLLVKAKDFADARYVAAEYDAGGSKYIKAFVDLISATETAEEGEGMLPIDAIQANLMLYKEVVYTYSYFAYDLLKDKLAYNPQRIISPGWDDQDINSIYGEWDDEEFELSPLHLKLMDVAYHSRCATSLIDIPKNVKREGVKAYAEALAQYPSTLSIVNINILSYASCSSLFAPWGQYQYTGTSKQNIASPSFLALQVQRAMILNQSIQYEWALPTSRKHALKIGKLDYSVSKSYLDEWQASDGVGINAITYIPDLGVSLWGNSTLYDVPPASYQALASLSTRYLVNAVENVAYKCGISITYQYNNDQAYNKFYAGITPILDTMKNVGAIDDYYVRVSLDINLLDQVNANSVIAKVYLVINGVVNDITVDLIALPPGTDLNQYRA